MPAGVEDEAAACEAVPGDIGAPPEAAPADIGAPAEATPADIGAPAEATPPEHEMRGELASDAGARQYDTIRVFRWARTTGGVDLGRHEESATRMGRATARLRLTGPTRPLYRPPNEWAQLLDEMEIQFPNFCDVLRYVVRPHAALTARGLRHRMPPLLLVGPPGIGKTKFARSLAAVLGLPDPLFIPIAGETNGSRLGGSSTFWANASPGQVFEMLAWGHRGKPAIANALVVIDEIDKASTGDYDPVGALYDLLEADTAHEFVDQALPDIMINAAHLHLVCTANVIEAVPLPIRNRMLTFEIQAPAPEQAAHIVRKVFEELVAGLGVDFATALPQSVVSDAAAIEPRQTKLLLEAALASALAAERGHLQTEDWLAVRQMIKPRQKSVGFVGST